MTTLPVLKVVLAGEDGVGKTSLSHRFCEGSFETAYPPSVGVDFHSKIIDMEGEVVKLSIWDLAGQERFEAVRAGFYRGSLAAGLVYDLTQPESLKRLVRWYQEIARLLPGLPFVVIGNKADLAQMEVDRVGMEFAKAIRAKYARASALSGEGVEAAFSELAQQARSRFEETLESKASGEAA